MAVETAPGLGRLELLRIAESRRPGEGHRRRRGDRRDGAGHPDRGPPQIRPGARDRRRDRSQDRRHRPLSRARGGRGRSRIRRPRSRSPRRSSAIPAARVGDHILEPLPPIDLGRIAAQSAKQVIVQKVREAERERQYSEYKDRIGEIVVGEVKRIEYGNVLVDLGRAEAIMRRDELHPARDLPQQGPGARLRLRRPPRGARAADLPLAHPPAVHGQAVRAGGAGDLRRHHRDQGGRPRPGLARQDRGGLQGQQHRSGRRLRRHARLARPGGGQRAGGREDRHHPLVVGPGDLRGQRAGAGRGQQGRARRGQPPDRGDRAGRPAVARDRPARPERAPGLAADRLGHRHRHRDRGCRAPHPRVQRR